MTTMYVDKPMRGVSLMQAITPGQPHVPGTSLLG